MTPHVKKLLEYSRKYNGDASELVRVSCECIEALSEVSFAASLICQRWDESVPDDCVSDEHESLRKALKNLYKIGE